MKLPLPPPLFFFLFFSYNSLLFALTNAISSRQNTGVIRSSLCAFDSIDKVIRSPPAFKFFASSFAFLPPPNSPPVTNALVFFLLAFPPFLSTSLAKSCAIVFVVNRLRNTDPVLIGTNIARLHNRLQNGSTISATQMVSKTEWRKRRTACPFDERTDAVRDACNVRKTTRYVK